MLEYFCGVEEWGYEIIGDTEIAVFLVMDLELLFGA